MSTGSRSHLSSTEAPSSVGVALGTVTCHTVTWKQVALRTFHQSFALVQAFYFTFITDHHRWLLHLQGRCELGPNQTLDPLIVTPGKAEERQQINNSKTWEIQPPLLLATHTQTWKV